MLDSNSWKSFYGANMCHISCRFKVADKLFAYKSYILLYNYG